MNRYQEFQQDFNRRHTSNESGKTIQTAMRKIEIIYFVTILAAFACGFYFGTKETARKCAAEVASIK